MHQHEHIISIIESHIEHMTLLERRIAEYFIDPTTVHQELSSQKVTQALHISQAALTRFAKKCGFTGYREFIFQYLQQMDTESHLYPSHSQTTRRVLHDYEQLVEKTYDLINEEQLKQVALMIEHAERVHFFGKGNSALVAKEMKLRLMRLGVVCEALTNQEDFAWTTSILNENCLVIAFSLSGQTTSVINSLLDAREMGAKTVLVTTHQTILHQEFDETISVASLSQPYIRRISPQLPMLIMTDLLCAHFLDIDPAKKEAVFNSYWETRRLNGGISQKE